MANFQVDFSPLGTLGKDYEEARTKATRSNLLQAAGQGGNLDLDQLSKALVATGDIEGGMSLAKLKMAQQQADPAYQAQLLRQKFEIENKYQPQIGSTTDQYGNPTSYIRDPTGQPRAMGPLPGTPPPDPNAFQPPPGANPVEARKRYSDEFIKAEAQKVKDAQTASDIEPLIIKARDAYKRVIELGGTGPVVASDLMRKNVKYNPLVGNDAKAIESARQDYDTAMNNLQLHTSAFKGQGAVSDYERRLGAAQFPLLTAIDAPGQLDYLNQLHAKTVQTKSAGAASQLNRGSVLDRPQVGAAEVSTPPVVKPATQQQIDFAKQNRDAVLQQARESLKAGKSRAAVEEKLRSLRLDPKDL